ncbi:WGR domain protein [Enhygromyxa salina]|uniref:WGR domain protein n=2 Tax=Enhygromyxa salina TaxID=215803 RepID=A0A0C2CKJ7_9BACT|nr:WGR domain protein [Enhygromyxa salina]
METYRIRYVSGDNPAPALELVCNFMGVGLREARELVGTRGVILDNVSAAEARRVTERFAAIGAEVEVEPIWRRVYAYDPRDPARADQVIQRLRAGAGELVIDEGQLGALVEGEPQLFADKRLTERRLLVELDRWRARGLQLADSEIQIVEALSERDLALETALRNNPDDVAAHLIYGDLLQTRGDARGQLIALQHARSLACGTKLTQLEARERDLLARHASHLFGPLRSVAQAVVVRWSLGFIDAAFIGVGRGRAILAPLQALSDLLRLPIAARMTSLGVTSALLSRAQLEPVLCSSEVVACLRELELGDHVADAGFALPARPEPAPSRRQLGSAREHPSLTRLWSHLRKLEKLILHSDQPPLHELHSPTLEHLELHMNGLRESSSRRFVPGRLPRLRTLALEFANADRVSPAAFADLLALPELDGVTEVTLRLPNNPIPFALADVLASIPRLATLASLDLSRCVVDERAMQAITHARDRGRLPNGLLMPTLLPPPT